MKNFIGTSEYKAHKKERFRGADKENLSANLAFNLREDANLFEQYKNQYSRIRNLFFDEPPTFESIYDVMLEVAKTG